MDSFSRAGLTFDVADTGPQDGPVVILLHGFPQTGRSWAAVAGALAEHGYRCLVPDQRGYSPTARPTGRRAYRITELVEDVAALIDASGARRVHLVGHDWGAAVAWAVAARHPRRLASLTALSVPHPAAFLRALVTSRQAVASWYMYAFQLPALPERYLLGPSGADTSRFVRFLRGAGQSAAAAKRDAAEMAQPGRLTAALNWYRAMAFVNPRATDVRISVPTLFVWSDGDTAVLRPSAERCGDWVKADYRYEVLAGVSHWMPDEVPDRVATLLEEHIAAHPVG